MKAALIVSLILNIVMGSIFAFQAIAWAPLQLTDYCATVNTTTNETCLAALLTSAPHERYGKGWNQMLEAWRDIPDEEPKSAEAKKVMAICNKQIFGCHLKSINDDPYSGVKATIIVSKMTVCVFVSVDLPESGESITTCAMKLAYKY